MRLSLRLAQPRLVHRDGPNAIAAWRGEAGNVPLRLLRDGRVGPGRRVRASARSGLALCSLALAGLAAPALLPPRSPSGVAFQAADLPVPAALPEPEAAESGLSGSEVALALQAAGALSGPLPGRESPALRFGAAPDLPLPAAPTPDASSGVAPPARTSLGIARVTDTPAEPASTEPASIRAPAARPVASEPAPGTRAEPLATASLPRRAALPRAGTTAHPREAAAPAARPHPVALAARSAKPPAAGPPAAPEAAWTLPRALAPTDP